MTVSDLCFHFCPMLTVEEVDLPPNTHGRFFYNAVQAGWLEVRSLDATDTPSLAAALHEIAHYERYQQGVRFYRLPHKQVIERCVEEIFTDNAAVVLARECFPPAECRAIAAELALHTREMLHRMSTHYQKEEAPAEFVQYELGELLADARPEYVESLINLVVAAL